MNELSRTALPDTPHPFAHHPELRGRVADPETSFFRTFDIEAQVARDPAPPDREYPRLRQTALKKIPARAIRRSLDPGD